MSASRKDAKTQRKLDGKAVLLGQSVDDALHTRLEERCAEIDQEAELSITEFELSQDLFAVDGRQLFQRFQFNDHKCVHKQVRLEALFKYEVVTANGNRDLSF